MDFLDLTALSEYSSACGNSIGDLLSYVSYSISEVLNLVRDTCQEIIEDGLAGI